MESAIAVICNIAEASRVISQSGAILLADSHCAEHLSVDGVTQPGPSDIHTATRKVYEPLLHGILRYK